MLANKGSPLARLNSQRADTPRPKVPMKRFFPQETTAGAGVMDGAVDNGDGCTPRIGVVTDAER